MTNINDVIDTIMQMEADDLEHIVTAITTRRDMLNLKAKAQFRIGDRVKFFSRRNQEEVVGTVMKINRKKIVVSVGAISWTVPPTMLEGAE